MKYSKTHLFVKESGVKDSSVLKSSRMYGKRFELRGGSRVYFKNHWKSVETILLALYPRKDFISDSSGREMSLSSTEEREK